MKALPIKVEEQLERRELTEAELNAVSGGFFLGRLLASYNETYLKFEMNDVMVSGY